jgi:hypothetical protein
MDLSKHVETINSNPHSAWTAAMPKRFEGMSRKEIKAMMGTVVDPDWAIKAPNVKTLDASFNATLPTNFTVGTDKWSSCQSTVMLSRD